jgi:predicted CopG family antitoxin
MKNYRTTITLPTEVYRAMKVRAAYQNKSVSRLIRDLVQGASPEKEHELPELPFGKYQLKDARSVRRQDIYETHLRNKVSG